MDDRTWKRIFKRLQEDILDRKGVKWEWAHISNQVIRKEISPAWRKIIEDELKEEQPDAD